MERLIARFVFVLLFLSAFAQAAGSSTGDAYRGGVSDSVDSSKIQQRYDEEGSTRCDSFDERVERIKCRLELKEMYRASSDVVEETCMSVADSARCTDLYSRLRSCYSLNGQSKDQCFKRAVGFTRARLSEEVSEKNQKAREYVIALLYDLQEKVEQASEAGRVSEEKAAEIIDQIVEIKQKVLNGATKEEVRQMIQSLKTIYREESVE